MSGGASWTLLNVCRTAETSNGVKAMMIFRLRVGPYRILYTLDNGKFLIYVIDAGNRGQIYNRY